MNCGEIIPYKRKQNGKYCSDTCQYEGITKVRINEWLNGKDVINHAGVIKTYFMNKYNNKCEVCGWGQVNTYSNTIPLEIHHIDGNKYNNIPENIKLLCPNCHSLTSTNKGNKRGYA